MSIVRNNLMNKRGYTPYCGNSECRNMPRTRFNGSQFICPDCGWKNEFPKEFIEDYKKKWNIK